MGTPYGTYYKDLLDQAATRRVDQYGAALHSSECACVDHCLGFGGQREVQAYHIGFGEQRVQRAPLFDSIRARRAGGVDEPAAKRCQHRGEQAYVGQPVLLLQQLDPDVEGVAGQCDDDRVVLQLAVVVELAGDDAVLRVLTCGESGDAHPPSLSRAP